jgi:hypothetical protein
MWDALFLSDLLTFSLARLGRQDHCSRAQPFDASSGGEGEGNMIEDDDSKIRRNLLVFSVLVILAQWFDIQLSGLTSHVIKLETRLDPLKLCAAALAALTYLALRYKDAQLLESKKYLDIVDADLAVITPKVGLHYAQALLHLYTRTGFEASIFLGHLKTFVKQRAANVGGEHVRAGLESIRPTIYLHSYHVDEAAKARAVAAGNSWDATTTLWWRQATTSGGVPLAIEAKGIHRCFIWVYSRVWWFFFCEAAVRARIPVLFGLAAVVILCAKVWVLLSTR